MEQRTFIRHLRANPTAAERKLWPYLSARRLAGIRLNRQVKIGPYAADFAARTLRLAIELDGDSHVLTEREDAARTRYLATQGYNIIRFTNVDVMTNIEGVVAEIERILAALPSPNPSRQREGNAGPSPCLAERSGKGSAIPTPR